MSFVYHCLSFDVVVFHCVLFSCCGLLVVLVCSVMCVVVCCRLFDALV